MIDKPNRKLTNESFDFDEIERAVKDGRIIQKDNEGNYQDYLIEINVKITKLKRMKTSIDEN